MEDINQDTDQDTMILRAKWMMDGAQTLAQAAAMARAFADDLDRRASEGWVLVDEVEDDYACLRPPKS